jgi:AcrR family transcriptional regulator
VPLMAMRKSTLRVRGIARRERLLEAARTLLQSHELDAVSLGDVAKRAQVPTGSAYHFYANIKDVYAALITLIEEELHSHHSAALGKRPRQWSDIVEELIERGVEYYSRNPAARKLLIGPHTPADLKYRDRQSDIGLARIFEEQVGRVFRLPNIPDLSNIFFRAVEIADLMFCLSMLQHGSITESMKSEAKRASVAYLATYLPRSLPKKPVRSSPRDAKL